MSVSLLDSVKQRELRQMSNVANWPLRPMLPVKHTTRRDPQGFPVMGIMIEGRGGTVYKDVDIFFGGMRTFNPDTHADKEVYADFAAAIADGWVGD